MSLHDARRGAILRNIFAGSWICLAIAVVFWLAAIAGGPAARYEWKLLNAGGLVVPATGFMFGALSLRLGPHELRRRSLAATALNGVLCAYWFLILG